MELTCYARVDIDDYEHYNNFDVDEIFNAMDRNERREMYNSLIETGEFEGEIAPESRPSSSDTYVPTSEAMETALHTLSNANDDTLQGLCDEDQEIILTKLGSKPVSSQLTTELKAMVNSCTDLPSPELYRELKLIINSL